MSLVRKALRSAIVVRAVAFGNPDGSVWGAGLDAGVPAVIASGGTDPVTVVLAWNVDSPEWDLTGDGIALTVSPVPEPQPPAADDESPAPVAVEPEPAWSGRQELCRVVGTVDGVEIDCVGVRTELTQVRPGELGTVRGFSAWVSA